MTRKGNVRRTTDEILSIYSPLPNMVESDQEHQILVWKQCYVHETERRVNLKIQVDTQARKQQDKDEGVNFNVSKMNREHEFVHMWDENAL